MGGIFLGHAHNGRQFLSSVHGTFASVLFVPIATQLALGVYLKLHIHEESIRPWAVKLHGIVGKSYPILGWTQMLFGAIAFRGYCRGDNLGQCLAHYIMVCYLYPSHTASKASWTLGKRFYRIRCGYGHNTSCWRGLDEANRPQPRVLGLVDYHSMGKNSSPMTGRLQLTTVLQGISECISIAFY
jgi:hypothetical protein